MSSLTILGIDSPTKHDVKLKIMNKNTVDCGFIHKMANKNAINTIKNRIACYLS
jgi:hypothetical protein